MKIILVAYGVTIIIFSVIMFYMVEPGVHNCKSTGGLISSYMSKDYAEGCQNLSYIQFGTYAFDLIGVAIIVFGILGKSKAR